MRWKAIPGWEDRYEVSDEGDVRRTAGGQGTRRGTILLPILDRRGYHTYTLQRPGFRVRAKAHRLVLEAFVGPAPDGAYALHADDNPSNNSLANLRWGTALENAQDRSRNTGWSYRKNQNAGKTHCKHGHAFDETNTLITRDAAGRQHRRCRACKGSPRS